MDKGFLVLFFKKGLLASPVLLLRSSAERYFPVGHGGRGMLEAIGRRAKQWIDVDAVDKRHSIDNRIAGLGGKYDKAPKPYAKTFIESNTTHGHFESMMLDVEHVKGQTMDRLLFPGN